MSARFACDAGSAGSVGTEVVRLLLVDDNAGDARLIEEMLGETNNGCFELTRADRLSDAVDILGEEAFGVVLLDLCLPDSQGLETLRMLREKSPSVPVIVVTGSYGDALYARAMEAGAQGYLMKGRFGPDHLAQVLESSRRIFCLQMELREAHRRERQERNLRLLERLSGAAQTAVTTFGFDGETLRQRAPESFHEMIGRYGELLEILLLGGDRKKTEREVSDGLRTMAEELGVLKAGPSDLLEIHSGALKLKSCGATIKKAEVCAEEGRLMLLEIMGHLVSYYRNYSSYTLSIINCLSPARAAGEGALSRRAATA